MEKPNLFIHYVTRHAQIRFGERACIEDFSGEKNLLKIANAAYRYGKDIGDFNSERVINYLTTLTHGTGRHIIRVYRGYVFIFDMSFGGRLVTIYKIPQEYSADNEENLNEEVFVVLVNEEPYRNGNGEIVFFKSIGKAKNFVVHNKTLDKEKIEIIKC